ncbi:hypothetical protein EVAR_90960_1 [Eumeta japonica]|uniref:Uncharacterized protein n=1 Tax=Eumeta variegata TaxID=151549 RepID=A0A4C1Z162_EUMVA|nr:hypothetical protein EVAR_90960_1 [Eumeta japonica]
MTTKESLQAMKEDKAAGVANECASVPAITAQGNVRHKTRYDIGNDIPRYRLSKRISAHKKRYQGCANTLSSTDYELGAVHERSHRCGALSQRARRRRSDTSPSVNEKSDDRAGRLCDLSNAMARRRLDISESNSISMAMDFCTPERRESRGEWCSGGGRSLNTALARGHRPPRLRGCRATHTIRRMDTELMNTIKTKVT